MSNVQNTTGTIAPGPEGDAGLLTIMGDYDQGASAHLEIHLGGYAGGTEFDRLALTPPATAALDGTLDVTLVDGFVPSIGDEFTFLKAGSVTGDFTTVDVGDLPDNIEELAYVRYDADSATLVICDACDLNCDGAVDTLDIEPFIDLLVSGASPCSPCAGDVDRDGTVTTLDIEPFIDCLLGP
jgi:hypothetical protein